MKSNPHTERLHIRLSSADNEKILELSNILGMNKTETILFCIDKVFKTHINKKENYICNQNSLQINELTPCSGRK